MARRIKRNLEEELTAAILEAPPRDEGDSCPLCGYGAWWGTIDTKTGRRPHDEAAARKLAKRLVAVIEGS